MKEKKTASQKLSYYATVCCTSYTLVTIILSSMNVLANSMSSTPWVSNIQLFAVCLCISVLMFLTDSRTGVIDMEGHIGAGNVFIHLLDVGIPVIGLGGFVFRWFDPLSTQVLMPVGVMVAVYFIIYFAALINNIVIARNINEKIRRRKDEQNNGREDN